MASEKRERVCIEGRVLYLTEEPGELASQLYDGVRLDFDPARPLIDNISTDELTPGWVCYYYDETLARYCLVGLRGGGVKKDAIAGGSFGVVVSGKSKGCGSSRETAPFSELTAGVQLVIAESIEKIYGQNCQNIGLLTSTDFGLIERIEKGMGLIVVESRRGGTPPPRTSSTWAATAWSTGRIPATRAWCSHRVGLQTRTRCCRPSRSPRSPSSVVRWW